MLDKSRSYSTVSGYGENHAFEQDGKKFDGMGHEIVERTAPSFVENMPIIVDQNANGYKSIKEIKAALIKAGIEFNPRNNSRKSLLNLLGVN
jgi:hypothetical protein